MKRDVMNNDEETLKIVQKHENSRKDEMIYNDDERQAWMTFHNNGAVGGRAALPHLRTKLSA